jgi:TRAP-type C4-dicarboxylate transport system substrate-binding protein
MFYIRIEVYGHVAWKTNGWTSYLKLDRYTPNQGRSYLPFQFETYEEANKKVDELSKRYKADRYNVEEFDSPLVQNWLEDNKAFYKVEDGNIINIE